MEHAVESSVVYDEARVQLAGLFAVGAHCAIGQKRKGNGCEHDYHIHPIEVREILRRHGCSYEQQAAGLLHDVVEDTKVTMEQLRFWFGSTVARLVCEVTKITRPADGCRAVRASIERAWLRDASPEGQDIKLADCISNMRSCHYMGEFASVWLAEKELLIPELTRARASLQLEASQCLLAAQLRLKETS